MDGQWPGKEGDVPIDDIHLVILLLDSDYCGYFLLLFIVPRK